LGCTSAAAAADGELVSCAAGEQPAIPHLLLVILFYWCWGFGIGILVFWFLVLVCTFG
jgi:hypothetical protein